MLTHQEFTELYKAGLICAHVNQSAAMHVCDRHPAIDKPTKVAHHFWKNAGCLLPIVGAACFFFIKWYWASLIIFTGVMIVIPAVRKSAAGFVLDESLKNDSFYYQMIESNVITYTTKT